MPLSFLIAKPGAFTLPPPSPKIKTSGWSISPLHAPAEMNEFTLEHRHSADRRGSIRWIWSHATRHGWFRINPAYPRSEESFIKKRIISLFSALFITTLACSISPQKDVFENERFMFSIPEGWWGSGRDIQIFGSAFQQIAGIRNPDGLFSSGNFTVSMSPLNDEASLETRFTQTYAEIVPFEGVPKQEIVVDEFPGYEISYIDNVGTALWFYRDIWLEKDTFIYAFLQLCREFQR
jgi:hypothetical protein